MIMKASKIVCREASRLERFISITESMMRRRRYDGRSRQSMSVVWTRLLLDGAQSEPQRVWSANGGAHTASSAPSSWTLNPAAGPDRRGEGGAQTGQLARRRTRGRGGRGASGRGWGAIARFPYFVRKRQLALAFEKASVLWPSLGRPRLALCRLRPNVARFPAMVCEIGRIWPDFGRLLLAGFGLSWVISTQFGPIGRDLAQARPNFSDIGQIWPEFSHVFDPHYQVWSNSAEHGPMAANAGPDSARF